MLPIGYERCAVSPEPTRGDGRRGQKTASLGHVRPGVSNPVGPYLALGWRRVSGRGRQPGGSTSLGTRADQRGD